LSDVPHGDGLVSLASVRKALQNNYFHAETLTLDCFNVQELKSTFGSGKGKL